MRLTQGGVSVWYGTPDAPAPSGVLEAGADTSVTIGIEPPNPQASISVLYRVNYGAPQTVAAQPAHRDQLGHQYFRANITGLEEGDQVEYVAIFRVGDHQIPTNQEAENHVASFTVGGGHNGTSHTVGAASGSPAADLNEAAHLVFRASSTDREFSGQLLGPVNEPMSFVGCHIEAYFARVADIVPESSYSELQMKGGHESSESGALSHPISTNVGIRVSATSDAKGCFTLKIPSAENIASEIVKFVVLSPLGRVIGQNQLPGAQLKSPIAIEVQKFASTTLGKPGPAATQAKRRIRGRVIERNGKPLPVSLQVLFLATEQDSPENGAPLPILVSKADAAGYFIGEVPNSKFKLVVAVVAGIPGESPIRLEDSFVPLSVAVVVELPNTPNGKSSSDCKCTDSSVPRTPTQQSITESPGTFSADLGTGQCVKFNVPNRAIEEFNFYSVVRTTQPDIVGITTGMHDGPMTVRGGSATTGQAFRASVSAQTHSVPSRGVVIPPPAHSGLADIGTGFAKTVRAAATGGASLVSHVPLPAPATHAPHAPTSVVHPAQSSAHGFAARPISAVANTLQKGDFHGLRGVPHPPGRVALSRNAPVDWDSTPTFYEAASIAHGHLLHFKQVWYADGYSLGDLLYSLPLAPGQKKLISVVDWERREQTSRDETTSAGESLQAGISRDRDVHEVVSGALSESAKGGSRNTTEGVGAGTGQAGNGSYQGYNFGGLVGVSGGFGESDSSAFQDSARNLSGSSMQTLRDRTLQSASAVRNLRSTIVQTAREGETVRATTEVIANHNHCHAITIQYFEVLRHFKVVQELADVQECLFIPFPMSEFDGQKVLRWRQPLSIYLQRRELGPAFDATRRVETHWSEVDTPAARYADELVTAIFGELTVTILIPLPPIPEKPKPKPEDTAASTADAVNKALNPTSGFLGTVLAIASGGASLLAGAATSAAVDVAKASAQGARAMAESLMNEQSPEERYARFQREVMPAAAAGFIDQLDFYALVGSREVHLSGADFTLVSNYEPGKPLLVSVRGKITNPISRADISSLIVKCSAPLPPGCRAIVNSASLRYQTRRFRHDMVNDPRVNDDIDLPIVTYTDTPQIPHPPTLPLPFVPPIPPPGFPAKWTPIPGMTPIRGGEGATLYTPLDEWEQRSPRIEDQRLSAELIDHLNANLEFYHHAIWWTMDPNRRYMLLDGFVAPNADGRSVASVVDNTLIGIVGNALVMPVARGNHLDPQFKLADGVTLLEHYDPQSPAPPSRVSLPTRGVFAEAVMGDCNSCEEIDDTRFWRWEESPIDEPPALDASAIASRRSEPVYGTPTAFPTPIVAMQSAPTAPDPTGLKAAFDTVSKQSFADITGLAGTQANAAAAYSKALDTALQFGKEASALTQQAAMTKNIGQTMRAIDKAQSDNKIDQSDAKQLRTSALKTMTGGGSSDPKAASVADRLKVLDDQVTKGSLGKEEAAKYRANIIGGLSAEDATRSQESAAAIEAISRIPAEGLTSVDTGTTKVTAAAYNPQQTNVSASYPQQTTTTGSTSTVTGDDAYQAVVTLIENPPSPSGDDFYNTVGILQKLTLDNLLDTLERLTSRGPGLESMNYLELFYQRAKTMSNVDPRVLAATVAELIASGGRTLTGAESVGKAGLFGQSLIALTAADQRQILDRLGLKGEAAEGAIASIFSTAIDMGIVAAPVTPKLGFDFGDWDKPDGMGYHQYLGISAHEAIAEYYKGQHPGHKVFTNYNSVQSIVDSLATDLNFSPGRIATALTGLKPDIVEFSYAHVPPGVLYEIKPLWWDEVAAADAAMYHAALTQAGVPVGLGPVGFPGTYGEIPAPNGYYIFFAPVPGVIGYVYLQAALEKIRARDAQQNRKTQNKLDAEALRNAGLATGLGAALLALAAAVLEAIKDGGFFFLLFAA